MNGLSQKSRKVLLLLIPVAALLLIAAKDFRSLRKVLTQDVSTTSAAPASVGGSPVADHVATITANNLFGRAAGPEQLIAETLPETSLLLVLKGVVASTNAALSSAMIEKPDKQTLNVVVGSQIDEETTVKAIQQNQIVLERRGRLETLTFLFEQIEAAPVISLVSQTARAPLAATPNQSETGGNVGPQLAMAGETRSIGGSTSVLSTRPASRPPTAAQQQQANEQAALLEKLNQLRNDSSPP